MIDFWGETLNEYSFMVSKSFQFDPALIKKQFIMHDRIPNGLPAIMKELARRGKLATPDQIYSGELYGKGQ